VTPYHHYQTHGLALSLAMLLALVQAVNRRSVAWCGVAGMCLGLVYLGKAELFVPALAMAIFAAGALAAASPARVVARQLAVLLASAALTVGIAYLGLRLSMPGELAWLGLRGNWAYLGTGLLADRFYLVGAGLENVAANSRQLARMFAGLALFAAGCAAADRLLPQLRRSAWLCIAAGSGLCLLLIALRGTVPWLIVARALPLVAALICACLWLPALRRYLGFPPKESSAPDARSGRALANASWLPLALWAIYALALLAKMPLKARFGHYGFVLAMPATLLLVAGLVSLLPRALHTRYGGGGLARALAVGAVAASAFVFIASANRFYVHKNFSLGAGADTITVEGAPYARRGLALSHALAALEKLMEADDTLLVYPEGIALNYWLRRSNPSRFNLFLPVELEAFGGDAAMLEQIVRSPPDFVAMVHRPHQEFGVGPFGGDARNGLALMDWIRANYKRVLRVGREPFTGKGFGIVLMQYSGGGSGQQRK
jgi:hypothetical protein